MAGESDLNYNAIAFLLVLGLFAGILLMLTLGQRLGRRSLEQQTDVVRSRLTGVETAIFGLMGLMIAFTFSGAASRYELRRQLTVEEANAIGTAYLRLDLLPAASQLAPREQFRQYAGARLAVYRVLPDIGASAAQAAIALTLQKEIWTGVLAALKEAPPQATVVVVPALNQMIDITTTRAIAARTHTPTLIFAVLLILGLVCSLLAGYVLATTKTRHIRLHTVAFALVVTLAIYVIFDLDYPRFGFIQLDFADKALIDLLGGMK
jgi:MFS family permease